MSDPFIAEIRGWGTTYAPQGWARCDGQQASIGQFQALFALIGNIYGPTDNRTYFTLPNLRGRSPMSTSDVPRLGLPPINIGTAMGSSTASLNVSQMPSHSHQAEGATTAFADMTSAPSAASYVSRPLTAPIPPAFPTGASYNAWKKDGQPDTLMAPQTIGSTGAGQTHENRQPYLTFTFCIATLGEWPSRN